MESIEEAEFEEFETEEAEFEVYDPAEVEGDQRESSMIYCDEQVEMATATAVKTLSGVMENLCIQNEVTPNKDSINQALDCAEALVKVLAVHHKGREIMGRNRTLTLPSIVDNGNRLLS